MIVSNLRKAYGKRVLFPHLSFQIEKGLVLIEGPSGCGKSTLLNILMGMEKPDSGEVDAPASFSYCGQEGSLFYRYSLEKNISLFPAIDQERFTELIDLFHFQAFLKTPLDQLSGGERQKGEILFGLAKKADVYYLDEPFSNLDKESKETLVQVLNSFSKDHLVFLINHEENLTSLAPSLRILFTPEKVEVISLQEEEKEMSREKKEEIKRPFRPFLALSHLLSTSKLSFSFQSLLLLAFSLLFALGTSYLNPKDRYENYSVSLHADPFRYHTVLGTEETRIPENFVEEVITKASYRRLYLSTSDVHRGGGYFLDTLPQEDTNLYYFPVNGSSLFSSGEMLSLKTPEGTFSYQVKKIEKDDIHLTSREDIRFVKEAIDGKASKPICFVNSFFLSSLLTYDTDCLTLEDASVSFNPLFSFHAVKEEIVPTFGRNTLTIQHEKGFHLAYPGKKENSRIKVGSSFVLTTEDGSSLSSLSLSKEAAIAILFLSGIPYHSIFLLSPFFDNEQALKAATNYSLEIEDVIPDYTQGNLKPILYYVLSALCLLFLLLFRFLSFKGEKRGLITIKKVYAYQELSKAGEDLGILLFEAMKILPSFVLSTLLYFFLFLPIANETMMKEAYPHPPLGYYYYSMEPQNPYYDNITSPLPFLSPHPLMFLLLALALLLLLLFFFQDLSLQKKKREARR